MKIKKLLCLLLTLTMILPIFSGCGKEKEKEIPMPVLNPELQLLEDSYECAEEITDFLTCNIDYVSTGDGKLSNTEILDLFEHPKIQVDDWDVVTLGATTMQEVVDIIDAANERYVTEKTDALIAERQKLIDEEYEAAKAKAEAAGKTYNEQKKAVRTDDINFVAPYGYWLQFAGEEGYYDYTPTYLVNPSIFKTLYLVVYKYDIPYMYFTFHSTRIYNTGITQESDWVVNAAQASYVGDHINQETGELLSYVDVDGLNKAAKKNMRMSGNILFSGEGFTWKSLEILCHALGLPEGVKSAGYEQSSNRQFAYYTIEFRANPFEVDETLLGYTGVNVPIVQLVATFDLVAQTCLNWTVNTYNNYESYKDRYHDYSQQLEINVHDYIVDTKDYEGMRETIHKWIDKNCLPYRSEYCVVDSTTQKVVGILNAGLLNADIEIDVDGTKYVCVEHSTEDGYIDGIYVPKDEYLNGSYINQKRFWIRCCLLNEDDVLVAYYDGQTNKIEMINGSIIYVANVETGEHGYKNVKVLDSNAVDQLLLVYVKTYQFNAYDAEVLKEIAQFDGVIAIEEYLIEVLESEEEPESPKTPESQE